MRQPETANKIAWVTGASQGLGRALAVELVREGWHVAISARNEAKLQRLARTAPDRLLPLALDVRDLDATQAALERIEQELGPVQLAILNAGTHHPEPAQQFKASTVRELIELNLIGTCNGLEVLLRRMRAQQQGHIAVVASLAGYRGLPSAAAYGASKAALINLMEALRLDLATEPIRLQLINPGFVKTPLTDRNDFPMPQRISARSAARHILRGLASRRFEIRFPQPFAGVMALLRLLPDWLYFPLIARLTGVTR